jgi:protein-S-isoprenylcysteine O-methyltransferase Ste14
MHLLDILHDWLIQALWIAWLIYWIAAAYGTKKTRRSETLALGVSHWTPFWLGIVLLSLPRMGWMGWLTVRIVPWSEPVFWIGVALVVAGMGFAVWARLTLGRNWSGVVTLKDDHTLIRGGPYGMVRHPIYTGLLLAILGSAVTGGEWRYFIGLALIAASFLRKLTIEERWLAEQFPSDYALYRKEVPALLPRLQRR